MLLRFRVTNHASLRQEQELSLIAEQHRETRVERVVPRSDHRTVAVAGVFGPNASGKSNVIHAMVWMRSAVAHSFARWAPAGGVPRRPFALDRDSGTPSTYVVDIVIDGVRYEYGFSCDDREFTEEWLYGYPEGRRRKLFERAAGGRPEFGRNLTGGVRTIAKLIRPNSLFLSVAAAQNHALLGEIYQWFRSSFRSATDYDLVSRLRFTADHYLAGAGAGEPIMQLLRYADFGIGEIAVVDAEPEREAEHERLERAIREAMGERFVAIEQDPTDRVRMEHRTDEGAFTLGLAEESSGTRTWAGLLGPVFFTLAHGTLLCVDELDARLHPNLTDALVGLFQSPETNVNGAQLVFSTHEPSLLGHNTRTELGRDQVWLTEKGADGATTLFPLSDFQVRDSSENKEKRYLVGRYGAVPFFDERILESIVSALRGGSGDGQASEGTGAGREKVA
ncbi:MULTISPECIES: ATP/GTP-binding protein [unclassified Streptomyces]|uniref:AAA family ATPase n=1 Tax=unclassified Streptomyces TaxID=2593676 RepID=UPI000CD56371|nr:MULTISPECIES: ATP-binding protein [unclassified Streptomyces]